MNRSSLTIVTHLAVAFSLIGCGSFLSYPNALDSEDATVPRTIVTPPSRDDAGAPDTLLYDPADPCPAIDGLSGLCASSLAVPSGSYLRDTDDAGSFVDGAPVATVHDYALDRYEVTVGRFRAFVNAGLPVPSAQAGKSYVPNDTGWNPDWAVELPRTMTESMLAPAMGTLRIWTDHAEGHEDLPMLGATWYEAFAYCIWTGGRLPTEDEWGYAYAGGSEQRALPWSVERRLVAVFYPNGARPLEVDHFPKSAGRWGHEGMYESSNEWVLDTWDPDRLPSCENCARLVNSTNERVTRSLYAPATPSRRPIVRGPLPARTRSGITSFRCAHNTP